MPPPTVAIVGAGIIGCMVAREVATRYPDAVLTILERDMVGSGASRRSAGLHVPSGSTERIRRMTAHSQTYYQDLKEGDLSLPIYPLGMTVVAAESSESRLHEIYLDDAALSRTDRVPNQTVIIPEGAAAWSVEGCQCADVYALTQALGRYLRPRMSIREGLRVTGIEPTGNGVALRLGAGEILHVDQVFLAPGPWIDATAWRSLVAPLGVKVKKIVALHIEQTPTERDHAVVFPDEDAFLLPLHRRGHWLFSYTCREWGVDPDAPADGLSTENVAEARDCLRRYAPGLVGRCTSGRVFCDAYSTVGEPLVRALDDAGRIVFAGAANGSGYRLAPAIASEAADLLHLPSKVWSLS
jgi:glycine/D-amino acid oxidase-like deaminating enzyme